MKKPTFGMKVDGFTVSFSFDKYQGGEKMSNFVSMSFKLDEPLPPEKAVLAESEASTYVTRSVILDALARGVISQDMARDMIDSHKVRSDGIQTMIRRTLVEGEGDGEDPDAR